MLSKMRLIKNLSICKNILLNKTWKTVPEMKDNKGFLKAPQVINLNESETFQIHCMT